MKNFEDIYNDYLKDENRSVSSSAVMQGLVSLTDFLRQRGYVNRINYEPQKKVDAPTVNLYSYDVTGPAMQTLDKGFNTMVTQYRRMGKEPSPALLSDYLDKSFGVIQQQANTDLQMRNQEAMINTQSQERANQINAQIEANNIQREYGVEMDKIKMNETAWNTLEGGMANIALILRNASSDKFNSALQTIYYDAMTNYYKDLAKGNAGVDYGKYNTHPIYGNNNSKKASSNVDPFWNPGDIKSPSLSSLWERNMDKGFGGYDN